MVSSNIALKKQKKENIYLADADSDSDPDSPCLPPLLKFLGTRVVSFSNLFESAKGREECG